MILILHPNIKKNILLLKFITKVVRTINEK